MMSAFKRPELAKIRRLELRRRRFSVADMPKVVSCPYLADLEELDLSLVPMSLGAVIALTTKASFTAARTCRMSCSRAWRRARPRQPARAKRPIASTPRQPTVRRRASHYSARPM
jgi:hypothetical protein